MVSRASTTALEPHGTGRDSTADLAGRLAALTLELVSIPSVTGDEAEICDRVQALCRERAPGASIHRIDHSLVVVPPGVPGRPTVGLFGHLDTVKPALEQPLGIEGGRVFGCGASDMKGALAVMLELLAEAGRFDRANTVYVFYEAEEGPAADSGLPPILEAGVLPAIDAAVCLEPTDNRIQAGCVGSLHARVTVHGRRAHSARPWQGDSAVTRALPLLERVAAFDRRPVSVGGLTFFEVMGVTQVATENSRNVVPDRLVLNVNFRFAPGRDVEDAADELTRLLRGAEPELEMPAGIDIEVIDRAPSGEVCTGVPVLQAWIDAHGIPVEAKQAWTDVAQLTRAGIPAINFGPGETAQAHQARESVPISMLVEGHRLLRALLKRAEL